jgi:hypothetical protein
MAKLTEQERRREGLKLHLLPEHLIAVGHVAVRSAILDLMIEVTAEFISLTFPPVVRQRISSISTPQKLTLIMETLSKGLPHNKHAIKEFVDEVTKARDERAAIMHRIWQSTDSDEIKELVDPRHWVKPTGARRVTAKSMMDLATAMVDLTLELADWKMLSTQSGIRRHAPSVGGPKLGPLPKPPRRSKQDEIERWERSRPRT